MFRRIRARAHRYVRTVLTDVDASVRTCVFPVHTRTHICIPVHIRSCLSSVRNRMTERMMSFMKVWAKSAAQSERSSAQSERSVAQQEQARREDEAIAQFIQTLAECGRGSRRRASKKSPTLSGRVVTESPAESSAAVCSSSVSSSSRTNTRIRL